MNLRRGFTRIGIGLAVLWLVFWTLAYVVGQPRSENLSSAGAVLSSTAEVVLAATAIVVLLWIVSGFRSN